MITVPLHTLPIKRRPPPVLRERLNAVAFNVVFGLSLVLIHAFQLAVLPLALIPHPYAQTAYSAAALYAKEAFASDLILITHLFGPAKLVLTADESVNLDELVRRDEAGRVIGFNVAKQAVWISNHQMYADWIYPWILMSFAGVSSGLVIILKASLEWAPIVGPAMQLFHFCFIDNRRKTLAKSNLFRTAQAVRKRDEPYQALLFPEGTLYSGLTQPRSAKYAATMGIPDAINVLLPRATGMLFTLRCLLTVFPSPSLALYDLTVGYAGVPARGYAQDYYSLQSIFGRGVSPPTVHLHFRQVRLADVPLGEVRASARPQHVEKEITPAEKAAFEAWLRARWAEKDELMGAFGTTGEFPTGRQGRVEFEITMRPVDWVVLASIPVGLAFAWKVYGTLWTLVRTLALF
ncbi:hypothetical protein JCM10207_006878 [Rhodosporidiobolus poonsookiae]